MAPDGADVEQDGPIQLLGVREGFGAEGIPVHGLMGGAAQVGARFLDEAVGLARFPRRRWRWHGLGVTDAAARRPVGRAQDPRQSQQPQRGFGHKP